MSLYEKMVHSQIEDILILLSLNALLGSVKFSETTRSAKLYLEQSSLHLTAGIFPQYRCDQ